MIDRRDRCENGSDVLVAYVILCIGATRVLAWRTDPRDTIFKYVASSRRSML